MTACATVGPKIVPFSRARNLQQGERLTLTCTVAKGDTPMSIEWTRDGVPVRLQKGLKVINVDQFSSMLAIASLDSAHVGNYSCRATNGAGTAAYAQMIKINGTPPPPTYRATSYTAQLLLGTIYLSLYHHNVPILHLLSKNAC